MPILERARTARGCYRRRLYSWRRVMFGRVRGSCCGIAMAAMAAVTADRGAWAATTDPQAVQEVRAGKRTVAEAAWWGFHAEESTAALQAAINSGAKKVVVAKMPSPWIVDQIRLADDQELYFEPGTEVLAKSGAFRGTADSLFSAAGKKNIRLIGPGATLRMRRTDYDGPEYKRAEWRHVLKFHGCTGVTVEGLTLAESGGDGIYLGAGSGGAPCKDVVIRDVICDRNYRQGISVISAENLLIERCVLKGTAGTPPAAGIDFEPNAANERLVNCVMRDCTIEDNQGYALHIYAPNLDHTSPPLSIRIENCETRGTNARSASIVVSGGSKGSVGLIELINCRFHDAGTTAITINSTTPKNVRLRMVNCTLDDPAQESKVAAPILLQTRPDSLESFGGIEFAGVTIRDRIDRPLIKYDDPAGVPLVDVTGTIIVEHDGQRREFLLDEPTLAKLVPQDPATRIARWPLNKTPLTVSKPSEFAGGDLPMHRLRGEALFLVPARRDDNVTLRLASQSVGRTGGSAVPVEIVGPSGNSVKRLAVEFLQEADVTFTADETGLYRVACQPGTHTVRVASSSHAALIAADAGPIHLLNTAGEFFFLVPAGAEQFAVRFWGSGDLERVSAAVYDPAGTRVWQQDDISSAQSYQVQRPDAARDEVWRLSLSRPKIGVLEDHFVEMRGIPTILGFRPDGLPTPIAH
ncbi:MAG: right-handed parallel beta-helix repeat-containing protein [Planctomycetes bacterium]|nr:right-handed parallel beta-helix repeat-containing protein [Planctomycetota bacterium]